jgi:hypothetical protein
MTSIKRASGAASAAVLLALSLSACGGDAPTDASTADFCDAWNGQQDAFSDIDPEGSPSEQAESLTDALKKWGEELEEVGTPEGIPDDARDGFQVIVDTVADLDADDVEKAIEEQDAEFLEPSEDDKKKTDAFEQYAGEECGGEETPAE